MRLLALALLFVAVGHRAEHYRGDYADLSDFRAHHNAVAAQNNALAAQNSVAVAQNNAATTPNTGQKGASSMRWNAHETAPEQIDHTAAQCLIMRLCLDTLKALNLATPYQHPLKPHPLAKTKHPSTSIRVGFQSRAPPLFS